MAFLHINHHFQTTVRFVLIVPETDDFKSKWAKLGLIFDFSWKIPGVFKWGQIAKINLNFNTVSPPPYIFIIIITKSQKCDLQTSYQCYTTSRSLFFKVKSTTTIHEHVNQLGRSRLSSSGMLRSINQRSRRCWISHRTQVSKRFMSLNLVNF